MAETDPIIENAEDGQPQIVFEHTSSLQTNPFRFLPKPTFNFYHDKSFTDDQFKLPAIRGKPNITIKRLSELYPPGTSLFTDLKTGLTLRKPTKKSISPSKPSYLAELNMIPFEHFRTLIQPSSINQKGYYYVVMYKDGEMLKELIDDTVYYDQNLQQPVGHPALERNPWVHIILKAYAKKNKGYDQIDKCDGFDFMKTFSFPDWEAINPNRHKNQYLIKRFTRATQGLETMVARTKNDPKVGYFGFTPNCSAFVIKGHYQQYAQVFIRIESYVHDCWNHEFSGDKVQPEEMPKLWDNEFLMPLAEFNNIFHLMFTSNVKYASYKKDPSKSASSCSIEQQVHPLIHFEKLNINMNARDTRALVISMEVESEQKQTKQVQVGLSIYFPFIKKFDLVHQNHSENSPIDAVVPWCKAMVGLHMDSSQLDASYMESVKEKLMDYGQNTYQFLSTNPAYEFIGAEYFKGYSNELTHNFSLKPGKYYIRLKSEQKQAEYRCSFNITALGGTVKASDAKMGRSEQALMLNDCILSKARMDHKFITYANPNKKGSWISCRNQFETIGYGYIVVQTVKHNEFIIAVHVSPRKLKEAGYTIKGNKELNDYKIEVDNEESLVLILKHDKEWKSTAERVWPPVDIYFTRVRKS